MSLTFESFLRTDRPKFADLPAPLRLRKLIEAHGSMTRGYARCYRAVSNILNDYRDARDDRGGEFTRDELVEAAIALRDFVPRFYRWGIAAIELNANELAPGTYPGDTPPTQSMDWDAFNKALKEWLNLLDRMAEYERDHGGLDGFNGNAGTAGGAMSDGRQTMDSLQ